MGFGKEMQEFVASFQVGAAIKSDKRKQQAAEEASLRDNELAKSKAAQQQKQYEQTYSLNEHKLNQSQQQHIDRLGMTQKQIEAADRRQALQLGESGAGRQDTMARFNATQEAERRKAAEAKKKAIADNPLLDEEANAEAEAKASQRWPEQALPMDINPADRPGVPGAPPHVAPVLDAGLKYLQKNVVNGSAVGGAQVFASGQGARTPEELALMAKLVDPFGELDDRMRGIVVMTDSYERLVAAGKPEEAAAMAASIIQSARVAAAVHGGAALAKMQDGDTDGAIEQLEKGMNAAPDGRSVVLDRESMTFQYVDDQSGKVVVEGEITPENILALATGLKDGSAFWSAIMQAAKGDPNAAKAAGVDGDAAEAPDEGGSDKYFREKAITVDPEALTDAATAINAETETGTVFTDTLASIVKMPDGSSPLEALSPEEVQNYMGQGYTAIQELAAQIMSLQNVPPQRAIALAIEITQPMEDPNAWNFKVPHKGATEDWLEIQPRGSGTLVVIPKRVGTALIKQGRDGMATLDAKLAQLEAGRQAAIAADDAAIKKDADRQSRQPPLPAVSDIIAP